MNCELECQNLHYAAINNHLECFKNFCDKIDLVDEYILTSVAEHKHYSIIEYCLEQKFNYNEKFVSFIKSYNQSDIISFPLIQSIFNN